MIEINVLNYVFENILFQYDENKILHSDRLLFEEA